MVSQSHCIQYDPPPMAIRTDYNQRKYQSVRPNQNQTNQTKTIQKQKQKEQTDSKVLGKTHKWLKPRWRFISQIPWEMEVTPRLSSPNVHRTSPSGSKRISLCSQSLNRLLISLKSVKFESSEVELPRKWAWAANERQETESELEKQVNWMREYESDFEKYTLKLRFDVNRLKERLTVNIHNQTQTKKQLIFSHKYLLYLQYHHTYICI